MNIPYSNIPFYRIPGTGFVGDVLYSIYKEKGMLPAGHNKQYTKFDLTPFSIDKSGELFVLNYSSNFFWACQRASLKCIFLEFQTNTVNKNM